MYMLSQNNQNVKKENKFIPLPDLITKCKDYSKELTRKTLVDFFRAIDKQFFDSKIRKENFESHGRLKRSWITSIGEIKFKRRYYVPKDKQKYSNFFFVDSYFNLPKYARLTPDAILAITNMAVDVNATYAADNALWDTKISRQTVSNILRKFTPIKDDLPVMPEIIEEHNQSAETVYIELDEAHCNLQNGRNIIANLGLIHTGHIHTDYACKRKQLENKHYFGGLNVDTSTFNDRIYDYISKRYNLSDLKYAFVSGDGAKWINSVSEKLKRCLSGYDVKVIQVLDKFHLRKRLTTIFSGNRKLIRYFLKNTNKLTEEKFIEIAYEFYKNNPDHKCNETSFYYNVNYICNNFEFIKNQKHHEYKAPCSMEGHVSHVLASRLTSRPKGFSRETLETMVQLLVLKANLHELTVKDLYAWKNYKVEVPIRIKRNASYRRYKRNYDFNVHLEISNSNNTKMRDCIRRIASPRWFYS